MRFRLTPATGEIWLHTISGREYVVVGRAAGDGVTLAHGVSAGRVPAMIEGRR